MRVLIDCDPGIDDTLALTYLAALHRSGEHELVGVTTSAGNATAGQCFINAAWVMEQLLIDDPTVPIAPGSSDPLRVPLVTTPETHGPTGLGYVNADPRVRLTDGGELPKWDEVWCDAIAEGTEDLALIVTGPMTNLARFRAMHPVEYQVLRNVTVMGGAINHPGNTTPTAEWNFWVDPHAAKVVLDDPPGVVNEGAWDGPVMTLCSLELTERMVFTAEDNSLTSMKLADAPLAKHIDEILNFYHQSHESQGEGYQSKIHDLLTCMIALNALPYVKVMTAIDIETESELMRGTVSADWRDQWEAAPNVNVVHGVDIELAKKLFYEALDAGFGRGKVQA